MTELEKAAMRMALEALQHYTYGGSEYRKPAELAITALTQAIAATEPVPERLREAFEKRGFVVPTTLREAINSAANIMCEDGTIIANHDAKRTTTERKGEPVAWVDVAPGDCAQLGDRIFSGGKVWQTIDEECGLFGREITDAWWPVQRRAK